MPRRGTGSTTAVARTQLQQTRRLCRNATAGCHLDGRRSAHVGVEGSLPGNPAHRAERSRPWCPARRASCPWRGAAAARAVHLQAGGRRRAGRADATTGRRAPPAAGGPTTRPPRVSDDDPPRPPPPPPHVRRRRRHRQARRTAAAGGRGSTRRAAARRRPPAPSRRACDPPRRGRRAPPTPRRRVGPQRPHGGTRAPSPSPSGAHGAPRPAPDRRVRAWQPPGAGGDGEHRAGADLVNRGRISLSHRNSGMPSRAGHEILAVTELEFPSL